MRLSAVKGGPTCDKASAHTVEGWPLAESLLLAVDVVLSRHGLLKMAGAVWSTGAPREVTCGGLRRNVPVGKES